MKKIYLFLLMLLLSMLRVNAQVNIYSFTQSNGVYQEITDGTVLATSTGVAYPDSFDDLVWTLPNNSIPFNFNFNNSNYTALNVSSNGFVTFGVTLPGTTTYVPISSTLAYDGAISAWGRDINGAFHSSLVSNVSWKVVGQAPNREFVIQYKNVKPANDNGGSNIKVMNFQIRLVETSNIIKIVYGPNTNVVGTAAVSNTAQIGLRGASNADYLNRLNSTSLLFTASVLGTASSSTQSFNTDSEIPGMPTNGLTYIFTPPAPCTGNPSPGIVSISNQFVCSGIVPSPISVSNVNMGVSGITYQWQMSNDNGVSDPWVNVTGGTGATTLTYAPPAFQGSLKYYRLKTTCATGNTVAYSNVATVSGPANPTLAPSALTFTDVNDFSMKLNWENGNGNRRMVVINEVNSFVAPNNDSGPALIANGTYSGTGQQIVYDGVGTNVTINGLKCSTTYYVRVYEYIRCGTSAPFNYWYGGFVAASQMTTSTTLSTNVVNLPQVINFTGFNTAGDNLATILPGWNKRSGNAPFVSNNSTWKGGISLQNIPTARVNLFGSSTATTTRKEWLISPIINVNISARVKFKAAITTAGGTVAHAVGMQGTNDQVQVMISTDPCGNVWTPLFTFNAANTVNLKNILQDFNVQIPAQYVGQNVRIGFKATDARASTASPDYDFHIANIVIAETPPCADVYQVVVEPTVTKNSASISWNASIPAPALGYEVEIRTEGLPGTPGAVQTVVTGAGVLTVNFSGLTPSTTYYAYVRSVCTTSEKGLWSEVKNFTTLCNYPDLLSVIPATRCGIGTVDLVANYNSDVVKWYASATSAQVLHEGNTFTTPEISVTTSYWVQATNQSSVTTGRAGILAPSETAGGFLSANWGIVFNLTESTTLLSTNVYSLTGGTLDVKIVNSANVEVFSTGNINIINGGRNTPNVIPLNVNLPAGNGYKILVKSFSAGTELLRESVTGFPYLDSNGILNIVSSEWGGTTTSTYYFFYDLQYEKACTSERKEVVATVTPAPAFAISKNQFEICANESDLVTITTGATDFDTYVWSPNTGVTGSAAIGWSINATENTRFTLTASQSGGSHCAQKVFVDVKVKPIPTMLPLQDSYTVCANDIIELKVGDEEMWTFDKMYGFEEPNDLKFTHVTSSGTTRLVSDTSFFSQGIRSVKFSHETSSLGYFTQNESLDLRAYQDLYIEFDHVAILESTGTLFYDYGYLQYSINGGTSWVNFPRASYVGTAVPNPTSQTEFRFSRVSYSEWSSLTTLTSNSLWKTERFNIPDNLDLSSFKIRFVLSSDSSNNYEGWFIDNVRINGGARPYVNWEPYDNLYLDESATQPYYGLDVPVVYFKSTSGMPATTYTVSLENDFGCVVKKETIITANKANDPLYEEQNFCGPTNVNLIVLDGIQTGGVVRWYASATSIQPITTITTTGTYFVQQELLGCKSERMPALVNIHPYLQSPVARANQLFCGAATVQDLQATGVGNNLLGWFVTQNGTVPLSSSTQITTGVYYVSQNNGICWSPKLRIEVTVNPIPLAPSNFGIQQLCGVHTFSQVNLGQPTNTILRWYVNQESTTQIPLASNIITGTYYVAKVVDGCESLRVPVQFIMSEGVNSPIAQTQNFCGSATVGDLVAQGVAGAQMLWYTSSVSTTPLATTTALYSGTYYVSQTLNGCVSSRKAVLVRIISMTPPDLSSFTICGGGKISDLNLSTSEGTSYRWYVSPSSSTELPQDTSLQNGIYYVSRVTYGCETSRVPVNVSLGVVPNAPTGNSIQTFVEGATISNLVLNQPNILWFDSYNASQSSSNNLPASHLLVNGMTYYGVIVGPTGCPSLPIAVTVTVTLSNNEFVKDQLKYFPNPVEDVLNINYSERIIQIEVFDLLGKKVKTQKTDGSNVLVDLSGLSSGTYMIQLSTENKQQFIKVVKK